MANTTEATYKDAIEHAFWEMFDQTLTSDEMERFLTLIYDQGHFVVTKVSSTTHVPYELARFKAREPEDMSYRPIPESERVPLAEQRYDPLG